MNVLTKVFLLLIFCLTLTSCEDDFYKKDTPAVAVQSKISFFNTNSTLREGRYFIEVPNCKIEWIVNESAKDRSISLRFIGFPNVCDLPLENKKQFHQQIIKRVVFEWEGSNVNRFSTGRGLKSAFTDEFTLALGVASAKSDAYQDFKKNYPNHKSGSVNQIMVDLINEQKLLEDFYALWVPARCTLSLKHVEKVFTEKVSSHPLKEKLLASGVALTDRVIKSAGLFEFDLDCVTKTQ